MGPVFSSALFHEANTNGDSALLATYTIDSEPLEPGFLTGTYGSPSAYYPPDHRWRRWMCDEHLERLREMRVQIQIIIILVVVVRGLLLDIRPQ